MHPDIKRTDLTVSQLTDEVLFTGLVEMEELDALDSQAHGALSISDGVPDIADGFMSSSDVTGLGNSLNYDILKVPISENR